MEWYARLSRGVDTMTLGTRVKPCSRYAAAPLGPGTTESARTSSTARLRRGWIGLAASLLALHGFACETSAPTEEEPEPRMVAGLMLIDTDNHGILFVRPDHHMASYDRVILDPIRVTFKTGSPKLPKHELKKLQAYLHEATARELIDLSTDKLVTTPGPCVLRIQTSFVDLELPALDAGTDASSTILNEHGSVTLLHAVFDSVSGELLLHYAERRSTPGGAIVGAGAKWRRMKPTFDKMLETLQDELIEKVPVSYATTGPLAACKGEVYKRIEDAKP